MKTIKQFASVATCAALLGAGASAQASSHREAPAIAEDQFADNTDVYAFISPENPDKLVVVANYVPLLLPFSGPNFYKFSDDVAYDIHFDNNGDAKSDIIYRFLFETTIQNGGTFLYNTGPVDSLTDVDLNVRQTYDVLRLNGKGVLQGVVDANVPVAPWNVGSRSFPGTSYDTVAATAVKTTPGGERLFAGPRDEPFFVDLHVFDLLGVGGFDSTKGVNVMSIVFEVPIAKVAINGTRPAATATGKNTVVGIHATASRRRVTVLRRGGPERDRGQFVQVSRLGWPLVNEVVIPLKDKDKFNRSRPEEDMANIGMYVLQPELTGLLRDVLNLQCPNTPAAGREDIVDLLSLADTTVADLLRIDIRAGQTFAQTQFPNGRKLTDDVTDTLLTVVCNAPGVTVADGVAANDLPFLNVFPFLASPVSGNPAP
ncbi:MAG TPA: DUF4331 domain-containing protein [Haliangium sp.]|nr:DUF4331 domain-containing protein [Haliangium sp.]